MKSTVFDKVRRGLSQQPGTSEIIRGCRLPTEYPMKPSVFDKTRRNLSKLDIDDVQHRINKLELEERDKKMDQLLEDAKKVISFMRINFKRFSSLEQKVGVGLEAWLPLK